MGLDFGAAGQDRGLSVRSHNLVRLFMMSLTERKLCPVAVLMGRQRCSQES